MAKKASASHYKKNKMQFHACIHSSMAHSRMTYIHNDRSINWYRNDLAVDQADK